MSPIVIELKKKSINIYLQIMENRIGFSTSPDFAKLDFLVLLDIHKRNDISVF